MSPVLDQKEASLSDAFNTLLSLADLTNLYSGGWNPMLPRNHGMFPLMCKAQSDRDTQIEDDPM